MTSLAAIHKAEVIGPTRQRRPDGRYLEPERTLGYAAIDWAQDYLLQPDGPDAGEPWRFTNEQARFLLHWYSVDQEGRFIYRAGMLRRFKGWGKSPLVAALACIEFLGPCRFSGWRDGEPLAAPQYASCIQIAAVSEAQVKRNVMGLFPALLSPRARREYELDIGKEIIYGYRGRSRIELLTSSARSTEGPRPTLVIKEESQHWLPSNGGDEMAAVIRRNAAKSRDGSCRILAISNAHAPGEVSDAELDYESYMQQPEGFLYDSIAAGPEVVEPLRRLKANAEQDGDRETLRAALELCRGDSTWVSLDRFMAECEDPHNSENVVLRFYFNRLAAGSDKAFDRVQWDKLAVKREPVAARELITLGFDGSKNRDHTALIGTHIKSGYQWVAGYWERRLGDDGDISIPEAEVDATVDEAFKRWNVWRLNADPYFWKEWLATWSGRYNRPGRERVASFDTTLLKKMSVSLLNYNNAIKSGELSHDGDPRFGAAIGNAYRRDQAYLDDQGERMYTIQKERQDSPLKIDAAMAGCLSWDARLAAVTLGIGNPPMQIPSRASIVRPRRPTTQGGWIGV